MNPRVRKLNELGVRHGDYVLYRMRRNRRVEANHALAWAAETANRLELPLVVNEILDASEPFANDRRHTFVLEGVAETAGRLRKLGIGYICDPGRDTVKQAAAVVTDDYPEIPGEPAEDFEVAAYAVDSSCVVPMGCIEGRAYAAYSLRPKIQKLLPQYLSPPPTVKMAKRSMAVQLPHLGDLPRMVAGCDVDHSVRPSTVFRGGRAEAERRLEAFLEERLRRYSAEKNEPSAHATSDLSPYLHFGFISPLEVALAVREYAHAHKLVADEFLEELIVRRELAFNFMRYSRGVDSLEVLPDWAKKTLAKHRRDKREAVYTREEFENGATADDLWNATQKELVLRGKIHGYYRMYWGKKIIEWSKTPEDALATMIYLHDRYALDGRDPNTYANILWCFGLHDRPWQERPVFGMVRYMSRAGMERKTDVAAYIREIEKEDQ
jgi:deoxyribodipyrimidine photo-lyase